MSTLYQANIHASRSRTGFPPTATPSLHPLPTIHTTTVGDSCLACVLGGGGPSTPPELQSNAPGIPAAGPIRYHTTMLLCTLPPWRLLSRDVADLLPNTAQQMWEHTMHKELFPSVFLYRPCRGCQSRHQLQACHVPTCSAPFGCCMLCARQGTLL